MASALVFLLLTAIAWLLPTLEQPLGLESFLSAPFLKAPRATNDTFSALPSHLKPPLSSTSPHISSLLRDLPSSFSLDVHLHIRLVGPNFSPRAPSTLLSFPFSAHSSSPFHESISQPDHHRLSPSHSLHLDAIFHSTYHILCHPFLRRLWLRPHRREPPPGKSSQPRRPLLVPSLRTPHCPLSQRIHNSHRHPSRKSSERPELDPATIDHHSASITTTVTCIHGSGPGDDSFSILNNHEWWREMWLLDFLARLADSPASAPWLPKRACWSVSPWRKGRASRSSPTSFSKGTVELSMMPFHDAIVTSWIRLFIPEDSSRWNMFSQGHSC